METDQLKDRIRGSLIGGAAGDALGYPVEFIRSYAGIVNRYGENGITRYDTSQWWSEETVNHGTAIVSDDTQMTLFTAAGLLNSIRDRMPVTPSICAAYIEWLTTQTGKKKKGYDRCWISKLPELNARRAPGQTCITALSDILSGREPHNNSKGCGGVMRIAPVPLYGAVDERWSAKEVCRLAGEAAELTHQHPLGYMSAALVAHLVYRLVTDEHPEKETCKEYIREGLGLMAELYPAQGKELADLTWAVNNAMLWSDISTCDADTIENELGGGWVAEEAAAIAIYCVLAHFGDFEQVLIAAVNHGGDSDSTGAIAGNIIGAVAGYEAIPVHFKQQLELHDIILHLADNLYAGKGSVYIPKGE